MKLKHLISTSAMIVAGFSSNQAGAVETSFLMCQSCPAGTYSTGGTSKYCTPCPAGQYQNLGGQSSCKACPAGTYSSAGATSCSPCASSTYSSWGGNCGPVTRTRTDYCTVAGSTSSTANSKTVTENGNYGNTCGVGSYCPSGTNKNCIVCSSKPSNSHWTGGCSWACDSGYTHKEQYSFYQGKVIHECLGVIDYIYCSGGSTDHDGTVRVEAKIEHGHVVSGGTCPEEDCCVGTGYCYGTTVSKLNKGGATDIGWQKIRCSGTNYIYGETMK
ncbi:MAG: hypothetical protein K6F04_02615 [bacterium]|nr:hypothetical protein [bacterium]